MRPQPELEPDVAVFAPTGDRLHDYDHLHLITYLRLLDAEAGGASWEDAARDILRLDPCRQSASSHKTYRSHLERARWMTRVGYLRLLEPSNNTG